MSTDKTVLDWSGSEHWTHYPRPCRFCKFPSHTLDKGGRPTHKVCLEAAIDAVLAARESVAS